MVGAATLHRQIAMLEAVGPVVEFLGVPNTEVDTGIYVQLQLILNISHI